MSDPSPEPSPRHRTMRDLMLVTGGRFGLLAGWFLATMLLARRLGPGPLGIYTLCQNAIKIATNCVGDPLDAAVMREAPLLLRTDRPAALQLIRSAFWLRSGAGSFAIVFAAAAPWAVSYVIFGTFDQKFLAILTAVGILGDLLLRSALAFFQASERFGRFMIVDVVWQAGRAVTVVVLAAVHLLSTESAVVLYAVAPFVAFVVALPLLPRDVSRLAPPHRGRVTAVLHFSKWLFAATVMSAVYERLDLFLLQHYRGRMEVGIYAGAMLLAGIPDFASSVIQTVLAPRVAPAFAAGRFATLQRDYLTYSIPVGVVITAAAVAVGQWVIVKFLSASFAPSSTPFRLLILGTMFEIIVTPLPAALLNFTAPRRVTVVTAAGLLLVVVGGFTVIPRYGATGAAAVIATVRILIGTSIAVLATRPPPNP